MPQDTAASSHKCSRRRRRLRRALDTRYRVAQLYSMATLPNLPLRIVPVATSFQKALEEIGTAAGGALDLQSTNRAAAALLAAMRLDGAPRPSDAKNRAALNQLLGRMTHQLNARLY